MIKKFSEYSQVFENNIEEDDFDEKVLRVSELMNDSGFYVSLKNEFNINFDSPIFREIEEFIVTKVSDDTNIDMD